MSEILPGCGGTPNFCCLCSEVDRGVYRNKFGDDSFYRKPYAYTKAQPKGDVYAKRHSKYDQENC